MSIEIYYFSGSGNSLYIAKEIQKRIPKTKLIPVISFPDKDVVKTDAGTIGFIFPIHGITLPTPLKGLIKKLDVRGSEYLFAIATRGGTKHNAFSVIDKILEKRGKRLDAYFSITMFNNDPKLKIYETPTSEKIKETETKIQNKLNFIQKAIQNKETNRETDSEGITFSKNSFINFILGQIILLMMKYLVEVTGLNNYFYADKKCTGCGTCEKVCLSKKIKVINKKPVWQNTVKCNFCYACLNFCPKQAVQIKSKWYMKSHTQENGRYPHPYATVKDISNQKGI